MSSWRNFHRINCICRFQIPGFSFPKGFVVVVVVVVADAAMLMLMSTDSSMTLSMFPWRQPTCNPCYFLQDVLRFHPLHEKLLNYRVSIQAVVFLRKTIWECRRRGSRSSGITGIAIIIAARSRARANANAGASPAAPVMVVSQATNKREWIRFLCRGNNYWHQQ